MADLEHPAEMWWEQITDRAGGRDRRGDGRRQKDHQPACGESERPKDSLTVGDTNNPKCPGLHSVKPRKVRDRCTSPEGRAVLHQAVDESFVCGQELRWAEEGLCTKDDSQSATGLAGQVGNVAFSGKIMADSETQKFE